MPGTTRCPAPIKVSVWRVAIVGWHREDRVGMRSCDVMATLWIHGGIIPPCPSCGAPAEDQNRRPIGADRAIWFCLICQRGRPPEPGWVDELAPISGGKSGGHEIA